MASKGKGKWYFYTSDSDTDYYCNYSTDDDDDGGGDNNNKDQSNTLGLCLEKLNLGVPTKKKKLLVLNLNGFLIHRIYRFAKSGVPTNRTHDGLYTNKFVYKRPFLEEFMKFCLERFEVGIWSSAQEHNVDGVLDCAFKGLRKRLLFIWDQDRCSDYGFKSLENKRKPLFFKELTKLWKSLGCQSYAKGGQFSETNTLLIDDEPDKGLLNPPNSGIYPESYDPNNANDDFLDPKGDMVQYLEGLAEADNVADYVKDHPFGVGQPAIDSNHPSWDFYSKIINRVKG